MATGFVNRPKGKSSFGHSGLWQGGVMGALCLQNAGAPTNGGAGTFAGLAKPGWLLIDTTNGKIYQNRNTQASPTWVLYPAVGTDAAPAAASGTFGGGAGTFGLEGNLAAQLVAAGVNPGATAADNVLAVYSLPAASLSAAGKGIAIAARGSFGATGNNKRIKIIANPATAVVGSTVGASGTTIADTGTVTTNGGGWSIGAELYKYGALGSNTQIGMNTQNLAGAASPALLAPALVTAVESGAILIAVTGNAATVVGDIALNAMLVNGLN